MALSSLLSLSNPDLPDLVRFSKGTPLELFAYAFRASPPGNLCWEHYSYIRKPLVIAERYLGKALAQARPGVNVLLYGPPGTGRTQLARLIASRLASALYEIACNGCISKCGDSAYRPMLPSSRPSRMACGPRTTRCSADRPLADLGSGFTSREDTAVDRTGFARVRGQARCHRDRASS
jgi:hypothetical protein